MEYSWFVVPQLQIPCRPHNEIFVLLHPQHDICRVIGMFQVGFILHGSEQHRGCHFR